MGDGNKDWRLPEKNDHNNINRIHLNILQSTFVSPRRRNKELMNVSKDTKNPANVTGLQQSHQELIVRPLKSITSASRTHTHSSAMT